MGGIASGAGSAFGSILSGLIASASARRQQRRQMQFNAREAQKDRDWQTMMSGSAFTRATEDLKRAGLNPILATGKQASTPSGATASYSGDSASEANSAMQAMRTFADIDLLQAQTDKAKSEKNLIDEKTTVTGGAADLVEDGRNLYKAGKDVLQKEAGGLMDKLGASIISGAKNAESQKAKIQRGISDYLFERKQEKRKATEKDARSKGWQGPTLEDGKPRYMPLPNGKWFDRLKKKEMDILSIRQRTGR